MNNKPQIYHGEWWLPADANPQNQGPFKVEPFEKRYPGTLTYYENEGVTLELYHIPSNFHSSHYSYNRVLWGKDANGNVFTLFDAVMADWTAEINDSNYDYTKTIFKVSLVLIGEHVISIDDTRFNQCVVQFPYLRNWAFRNNLTYQNKEGNHYHILEDNSKKDYLVEVQVENGIKWILRDRNIQHRTRYDLSITQVTELMIEATCEVSIGKYINQLVEFSQFLSIALYGEQHPSDIYLVNRTHHRQAKLLFKKENSTNPGMSLLIKFEELKKKAPSMLRIWHENYQRLAPISSYLVDSLRKNKTFDVPDFLILAQAIDGYHKRFVNKKCGKDHQKYEDGIKILLKQFEDVDCIQKCHIAPKVLTQSRDKYSHLLLDQEKPLAVEGKELFWLTEKCKILLTCCILDLIGLTNEEINLCIKESPIQNLIDTNPFEFE